MANYDKLNYAPLLKEVFTETNNIYSNATNLIQPYPFNILGTSGSTTTWGIQANLSGAATAIVAGSTTLSGSELADLTLTTPILRRGKLQLSTELTKAINGTGPGQGGINVNYADGLNTYIANDMQLDLAAILKGGFASGAAGETDFQVDLTALSGTATIISTDKLKQYVNSLFTNTPFTGYTLICHSTVYNKIMSDNASKGFNVYDSMTVNGTAPKLGGAFIIENDVLCTETDPGGGDPFTYKSFLVKNGTFMLGTQMPLSIFEDQVGKTGKGSYETSAYWDYTTGVYGLSFVGSIGGLTPTIAELETGANWSWLLNDTNGGQIIEITSAVEV